MKYLLLVFMLSLACQLKGQTENDSWMRARSAKGRFEVIARDAAQAQQLAFWSERSLKQLEKDWGTAIPFQRNQPLTMRIDPTIPSVELRQNWRQGVLHQTLLLSSVSMEKDPQGVANVFTRAMIFRLGLAALPPEEKSLNWVVPDWLIVGSAHRLLSQQSRALFEWKIQQGPEIRTLYPEEISQQMILAPTVEAHAQAALLCRWIFENNPSGFWLSLAREHFRSPEIWSHLFPNIGNLRELHIEWDLWYQKERGRLIAEFSMDEAARKTLEQERNLIPAFFGWGREDFDRHQPISFTNLKPYMDDPRFAMGMQQWILRLQSLRFRQSPAFNQEVEVYQQAAQEAVKASQAKGKKRERLWGEAMELKDKKSKDLEP